GAGTVGNALLHRLAGRSDLATGPVLVRDTGRSRAALPASVRLSTDPQEVLDGSDIVVELMGGTGLARELMLRALEQGKSVVSANKAVLAEHWEEFLPYIEQGRLYFEASVMAGTPAIAPLTGVLRGSNPLELHAILNGTCSFILSR